MGRNCLRVGFKELREQLEDWKEDTIRGGAQMEECRREGLSIRLPSIEAAKESDPESQQYGTGGFRHESLILVMGI